MSLGELTETKIQMMRSIFDAMTEFMSCEFFLDSFQHQESELVRRGWPRYYQLAHQISHSDLFHCRTILFDQCGAEELPSPARTIAVFAHCTDIDYTQLPDVMTTAMKCFTIEQVKIE
jgi:hypothetical protein